MRFFSLFVLFLFVLLVYLCVLVPPPSHQRESNCRTNKAAEIIQLYKWNGKSSVQTNL